MDSEQVSDNIKCKNEVLKSVNFESRANCCSNCKFPELDKHGVGVCVLLTKMVQTKCGVEDEVYVHSEDTCRLHESN